MDPAELMNVYGFERFKQAAMFTYGNDTDATRGLVYRDAIGTPYVQYHGQFMAIRESDVQPPAKPVKTSQGKAEPKAPKAEAKAKKFQYVSFNYGGNTYARKIGHDVNGAETVQHDNQTWPVAMLENVAHHYTKDAAQKRVAQERKNAKKAAKNTAKPEAKRNGNGCRHIPETFEGIPVDVQNADVKAVDTAAKWEKVTGTYKDLHDMGIEVASIVYERTFAWLYPADRSEEFAKFNHAIINFTSERGHSMKPRRRGWFVKL
jgi:hypothetical protein